MNCQPGDLAIIVWHTDDYPIGGMVVEVLYAAPMRCHVLPDGHPARAAVDGLGRWICESLGSPFPARTTHDRTRMALYASIPDAALRPLRGDETEHTEHREEVSA